MEIEISAVLPSHAPPPSRPTLHTVRNLYFQHSRLCPRRRSPCRSRGRPCRPCRPCRPTSAAAAAAAAVRRLQSRRYLLQPPLVVGNGRERAFVGVVTLMRQDGARGSFGASQQTWRESGRGRRSAKRRTSGRTRRARSRAPERRAAERRAARTPPPASHARKRL